MDINNIDMSGILALVLTWSLDFIVLALVPALDKDNSLERKDRMCYGYIGGEIYIEMNC